MAEIDENLDWREAVRKRPAMYVGSTGLQGFVHLLKHFFAPFHKYIDTSKYSYGKPVMDFEADKYSFEITGKVSGLFRLENLRIRIPSNINESLHAGGFECSILNALSQKYEFSLFGKDKEEIINQVYQKGILQSGIVGEEEHSCDALEIRFTLDSTIWEEFEFNPIFIAEIIEELAFLNREKTFELKYSVNNEPCRIIYHFENGLRDLIEIKGFNGIGPTIFETELEYKSKDYSADICFSFWDYSINEPFFKSFVNNLYTHEGGTNKKALLSGIGKALKKYVKENKPDDFFVITERTILSRLIGAIHLKMKQPSFYGSTRNRLSNKEIM